MELSSPAGSLKKLAYAYEYGADAAYMGLGGFSLRARADNFLPDQAGAVRAVKGTKKLYCALNIVFRDRDLKSLEERLEDFGAFPFDAFIVSDLGVLPFLRRHFPGIPLHLSTQANCLNSEAAKMYRDLGFSRIIPGRELRLKEIAFIKKRVPELEIEIFVHGAMCVAYSGRCFLSSYMTGRSSNDGNCAHSCRWRYRVLEESMRPGEYYPLVEGDGFTAILSSRDLCMIDSLKEVWDAGVDALKIEGRMRSVYYVAVATRAYRKALDRLEGREVRDFELCRAELSTVSHRAYSTGFYFGSSDIETPAEENYDKESLFIGTVEAKVGPETYALSAANRFDAGEALEAIGPEVSLLGLSEYELRGEYGEKLDHADYGKPVYLETHCPLRRGYLLRRKA